MVRSAAFGEALLEDIGEGLCRTIGDREGDHPFTMSSRVSSHPALAASKVEQALLQRSSHVPRRPPRACHGLGSLTGPIAIAKQPFAVPPIANVYARYCGHRVRLRLAAQPVVQPAQRR